MIIPDTLKYPQSCGPQCCATFDQGYPNHDYCRHSFTRQASEASMKPSVKVIQYTLEPKKFVRYSNNEKPTSKEPQQRVYLEKLDQLNESEHSEKVKNMEIQSYHNLSPAQQGNTKLMRDPESLKNRIILNQIAENAPQLMKIEQSRQSINSDISADSSGVRDEKSIKPEKLPHLKHRHSQQASPQKKIRKTISKEKSYILNKLGNSPENLTPKAQNREGGSPFRVSRATISRYNANGNVPSFTREDSLPEYVSTEEFIGNSQKNVLGQIIHPGTSSHIHIPGNLSPVYRVDEKKYNNVDFDDLKFDGEQKVIKLFQINEQDYKKDQEKDAPSRKEGFEKKTITRTSLVYPSTNRNRALSYICSDNDIDNFDIQKRIAEQKKAPIFIENKNSNNKLSQRRRQSLFNPLPTSLIPGKNSKSAIKRMSMTTEGAQKELKQQRHLELENDENFKSLYNIPPLGTVASHRKSESGYSSPTKRRTRRDGSVNKNDYSTNQINTFHPEKYFDIDRQEEENSIVSDPNSQMNHINQVNLYHHIN